MTSAACGGCRPRGAKAEKQLATGEWSFETAHRHALSSEHASSSGHAKPRSGLRSTELAMGHLRAREYGASAWKRKRSTSVPRSSRHIVEAIARESAILQ
jgi:hypothetical protein